MGQALLLWKQYPKQIEAGLENEYPGRDIAQWHHGELSSRKLLVLIEGLSAESWFKQELNRDLERRKAEAAREAMSAPDIRGRLLGEIRSPYDMAVSVVERRKLDD